MTSSPAYAGPDTFDSRDAVAVALRLALGAPRSTDARADWSLVLDAASREQLTALGWSRSGAFIRTHGGSVVAHWRRAALGAYVRGERQLELLREATDALESAGVELVVLKGLPLGQRLYGDPFVRCSADIDLFVPAGQRDCASHVLEGRGWRRSEGSAPWHESWSIERDDFEYYLELHSFLVSDHLTHLNTPAALVGRASVAGVELPTHVGEFVAPYLAVHLATHQLPPLRWLVDFATLWSSLSLSERERSVEAARAVRLVRYLDWARDRAALVQRVADGSRAAASEALGALGIRGSRRRDPHSIWRHLSLAASPMDRLRLLGAFLLPRRVRGSIRAALALTAARLRTRLRSIAGASRSYSGGAGEQSASSAPRGLRVEREEMVALTRTVVAAGGALHVRAPGGSMLPTIPRGAIVRIGPVPAHGIAVGDVVLALTADGEPVLHRAVSVTADLVIMRGDAALHADPPVSLSRVIGLATHVRDQGVDMAIGKRPRRSISVSVLKARRRIARMVRRAR